MDRTGARLRKAREAAGLSLADLARRTNYSALASLPPERHSLSLKLMLAEVKRVSSL